MSMVSPDCQIVKLPNRRSAFICYVVAMVSARILNAEEPRTWAVNSAAQSMTVIGASIPGDFPVRSVQVTIAENGEPLCDVGANVHRKPLVHFSAASTGRDTVVSVPVPASFAKGTFLFPQAGEYRLEWLVATGDARRPSVTLYQKLKISPPNGSDVAFLESLVQPEVVEVLFDSAVQQNLRRDAHGGKETVAVEVVRQLLEASLAEEIDSVLSTDRSAETAVRWAVALSKLALAFPESSYAPYAAHFAGCCYSATVFRVSVEATRGMRDPTKKKNKLREAENRALLISQDDMTSRAETAFAFACEHADSYLKPRCLLHFGMLKAVQLQEEESDRMWREAKELGGGDVSIERIATRFRREFKELREHRALQADQINGDDGP